MYTASRRTMNFCALLPVPVYLLLLSLSLEFADAAFLTVDESTYAERSIGAPKFFNTSFAPDNTVASASWYYKDMTGSETLIAEVSIVCSNCPENDGVDDHVYQNRTDFRYDKSSDVRAVSLEFMYTTAGDVNSEIVIKITTASDIPEITIPFNITTCPVQNNTGHTRTESCSSNYDYFNCTSVFYCLGGYTSSDGNTTATCQADATWSETLQCEAITCEVIPSDNYCDVDGNLDSKPMNYGDVKQVFCCDGAYGDGTRNYTCVTNSTFDPSLDFECAAATTAPPETTTAETTDATQSSTVSGVTTNTTTNTTVSSGLQRADQFAIGVGISDFCLTLIGTLGLNLGLGYALTTLTIVIYAVSGGVALIGVIMAGVGGDSLELNGVEIAGIVLGSIGLAGTLVAMIIQVVQGKQKDG